MLIKLLILKQISLLRSSRIKNLLANDKIFSFVLGPNLRTRKVFRINISNIYNLSTVIPSFIGDRILLVHFFDNFIEFYFNFSLLVSGLVGC